MGEESGIWVGSFCFCLAVVLCFYLSDKEFANTFFFPPTHPALYVMEDNELNWIVGLVLCECVSVYICLVAYVCEGAVNRVTRLVGYPGTFTGD